MIVKQVKLSSKDKERLARLKGKTGIKNWNVLCRWAICFSLSDPAIPQDQELLYDDSSDITWNIFGGEYEGIYELLIKERCKKDGLGTDAKSLEKYFKLHLNRGISYLSGTNVIRNINDLYQLTKIAVAAEEIETMKGNQK